MSIVSDPKKLEQFNVFIIIGLGFLVDITGGLNSYIITTSHKYRLITGFIIFASIFCVGLNYLLIPLYGGMGAAISYLITMTGLNFTTWLYIKIRFKMQPFDQKHVLVVFIAAISFLVGHYIWHLSNVYFDIVVRSTVTAGCYGILAYFCKISADINDKVNATLKKFKLS